MKRSRGRPRKVEKPGEPKPCVDCGKPGEISVDEYGIQHSQWRCRDCYEVQCQRTYREAYRIRYG